MAEYLSKEDMNTGEYISRDETLKAFHKFCENCDNYNGFMCRACADAGAMDIIVDIPAADVQTVKHGRWIINSDGYYPQCSECMNEPQGRIMTNYCPNCGAKMDGDKQ